MMHDILLAALWLAGARLPVHVVRRGADVVVDTAAAGR